MRYMNDMTADEILKKAQGHLSQFGDDKHWVEPNDLNTLIRAGAVVIEEKYHSSDKHWVTRVNYGGCTFVAISGSKLILTTERRSSWLRWKI